VIRPYRVVVGRPEREHLEVLVVYGRIILKRIKMWDGEAWTGIALAQDRDKWQALVNAVMNFGFHTKGAIS
jgi:hypothetical protein